MMDIRILNRRAIRLFVLAVVGGMLAVCASCAKVVEVAKPDPYDAYYDLGGFTVWSCNKGAPEFFISRAAHRNPAQLRAVWAHESSHRALMLTFGCERFRVWKDDPDNRLLFEAIAYCAEIHQRVRDGVAVESALADASVQLTHRIYGFGLTPEQARAKIVSVCP